MKNISYVLGFAIGLIIVLAIALIIRKTAKKKGWSDDFDERQQIARGKAFQTGFFAMLGSLGISICITVAMGNVKYTPLYVCSVLLIVLFIGILSCTIQLIWTDAYISFRNSPTPNTILFFLIGLTQIGLGFINKNDNITYMPNLVIGGALLGIAINMVMKMLYDKKHLKDDEESDEA